jgi:hypothetical protein
MLPTDPLARALVQDWGAKFDGSSWLMLTQTSEPLPETVFALATTPDVVTQTSDRPTGIDLRAAETPYGLVVQFVITLLDQPVRPLRIDVLVNPAPDAGLEMLQELARQDMVQILFFDANAAELITRRIIPAAPQIRAGLRQVCALGSKTSSDAQRWQNAIRAVESIRIG